MNALMDLGAWTLEQIRHVGRLALFSIQLFKELPAALGRFWLIVQQIHFIGNYSLLRIFVPAYLIESFLIEFFQACQFVFKVFKFAEIDEVVAYTRYQFDVAVGQHMDLFYLSVPELIVLQKYTKLI